MVSSERARDARAVARQPVRRACSDPALVKRRCKVWFPQERTRPQGKGGSPGIGPEGA